TGKKKIDIISSKIQNQFVKQDVNVSTRTIRQCFVKAKEYFASGLSELLLTAKHQIKYLEWAEKHINFN
ncbi:694_t:CDS:1, partial [Cetraspora pellucida]